MSVRRSGAVHAPLPRPGGDSTAERAWLAREIHDGLGQDLWLARMAAGRLDQHPSLDADARIIAAELIRALDSGLAEVRAAVAAMRADVDVGSTAGELTARRVAAFSDRFGIYAECVIELDHDLPQDMSLELVRILQEALNNVRKHAEARRVRVRLSDQAGRVELSVEDDGIGFDPTDPAHGFGRQSMLQRTLSIGGRLQVQSDPGRGTRVLVTVPGGAVRRAG